MQTFEPILTQPMIEDFDQPPNYHDKQLETLFRLPEDAEIYLETLRSATSKLSFIMQFSYCQATSQFFAPSTYPHKHVLKAIRLRPMLRELTGIKKKVELERLKENLGGSQLHRHRHVILRILRLTEMGEADLDALGLYCVEQVKKQMGPEALLELLRVEIQRRRWVIPSIRILTELIGTHYAKEEATQLQIIADHLPSRTRTQLLALLDNDDRGFYKLHIFKNFNEGTGSRALKENNQIIQQLRELYEASRSTAATLALNDQAIAYYARWVLITDNRDIYKLTNPDKQCLYLLAFVIHQLRERQDAAVLGFIKKFTSYLNRAKKDSEQRRLKHANQQAAALEVAAKSQTEILNQLKHYIAVGQDISLSLELRLTKVLTGLIDLVQDDDTSGAAKTGKEMMLLDASPQTLIYETLLDNADAIIRSLSGIVKVLDFDEASSNPHLFNALRAFKNGKSPQTSFLKASQRKLLDRYPQQQHRLYKVFLFDAIVDGFKSGSLNLQYGYIWLSLDNLLLGGSHWRQQLTSLLKAYNLSHLRRFSNVREWLTELQDEKVAIANEHYDMGQNSFLAITEKNKLKLRAYQASKEQNKPGTLSELLYEVEKLSVQDVLQTIQDEYNIVQYFVPSRNRHVNRQGDETLLQAAIIALGCNIGPRGMIKCSDGLSEKSLLSTAREWTTPANLRRATSAINAEIDKLELSKIFQFDSRMLHSSSDGQKIAVDGESLLSSLSFKYFGADSGVARYPTVDEKNRMLETFVFSASEREATYILDSLVGNLGSTPRMHSSDSHGSTDPVFAIATLLGIRFVPRIKGIEKLGLYGARNVRHYQQYGYKIRPTSSVVWSKIEPHWDDILRLLVTILSGKASASQLLRRLNSYSKNPLYGAIKELGKLIRTTFIIEYVDDLVLRQRIQKQLNIGEQANSFFNAVFWARGRRLHVHRPDDIERYFLSAQLIQACVVLWNYLYVTDMLLKLPTDEDRSLMIQHLQDGQMIAWHHINFSGEFNFARKKPLNIVFDVKELEQLKLKVTQRAATPNQIE